ncbi:MAG: thiamine pyrophosphate-binding protein, partial [Proteobacteria bacterium]|nr:thiamine pyrophosphate-binding protein [Pseudomonadota bacterium]
AIGPRLGEATTGGYTLIEAPRPRQTLVHVHASAEELHRVYQADLAINATMGAAAQSLATLAPPAAVRWSAWTAACHEDYLANREPQPLQGEIDMPAIDMPAIVATLERLLPPHAVLTNGAGNFASWLHRFFRYPGLAQGAKTQLAPALGAMGYGVPAGVAAAIADPGRTVLTLTGDGDFLMTGQELATAVQHGAKTIVVLLNNGMYGTIRMHQEREYPERVAGSTLHNPDFAALARSYGYAGVRIERTEQFEPELRAALARSEGTLIEVMLDPELLTTRATLAEITRASLQKQ